MSQTATDVLIVGAGPVGLTAAAALLHQGLKCRIIDKSPAPSDKSKALAVWCRSMELLDGLGLARTFVDSGLKLVGGSMHAGGKRLVQLQMTSDESPFGFPLMIPQNKTERILAEHITRQGLVVERQVELATFAAKGDVIVSKLRHADGREETVETSWLAGCDGAHSTVRHTLGLEFTGHAEPNDWMLADVHIEGDLPRDEVSIYWHEKGVVAFFPIDRDRFRMIADLGAASETAPPASPTLTEAQAKVDERGPGGLALSDPIWLANFRINERKVSDYRRGRVLLAGDAAHIHSPAGGQGMNTGMQDAFNLAWKLALVQSGQGQLDPLLDSYSFERSCVGDQVLKNAERFTTLATLRSPVARWLRNHIAPILGSLNVFQEKIRNDWFELSINYRESPLSAEDWPALGGGLAAGDRLCDAPLMAATDQSSMTLFDAIRGTGHSLLLLPADAEAATAKQLLNVARDAESAFPGILSTHLILRPGAAAPATGQEAVWVDQTGRLHEQLHATHSTVILVRPDGYLGYRSHGVDGTGLLNHLGTYLVRKLSR